MIKVEEIMYTNAQSLMAHKDEIHHLIMKGINPALVALSETRLNPEVEDYEVNVPEYSIVRCDAENRYTGGVVMYIRDDVRYEVVLQRKIVANCWCVAIDVYEKWCKCVIAVVYHSPSASDSEFIKFMEEVVEELTIKGTCIIIGDFNIDLSTDLFYANKLKNSMLSLGMKQYVNQATRRTNNSKTIIDLVFANTNMSEYVRVCENPKITDHDWIRVEFKNDNDRDKYREFIGREYKTMNIDKFVIELKKKMAQGQILEIHNKADNFVDNIVRALDIVIPKKIFKIPKVWEGKMWFSEEIREASINRDRAYRKAVYTGIERDWMQFKLERNAIVKLIKIKKREYYENMIDGNRKDPQKMWKTLKEILKGETAAVKLIDKVDFEGIVNSEEGTIANKFNEYYIKSINNIVDSIGDSQGQEKCRKKTIYIIEDKGILENFTLISIEELEKIVMDLPAKKGTEEGISSDILKIAFNTIKEEFKDVINTSLQIGECPNGWKTSTIVPIPKVEKPKKASDYRPINILPIYEKVLEIVVKQQIETYLENNKILSEHQSGFRKLYSCETAIQGIIDEWKLEISEGKMVGVIFMDLKRAFETVDRKRLLEKLDQTGIRGKVLEWLKSYLNNRTQQVKFNNQYSKLMTIENGVPQGSVLGPLLFILYINDIAKICPEESNVKLFADDTLIYAMGESCEELNRKMNDVFQIIEKWMILNKLKLNAEKTKYMIVRSVRKEIRGNVTIECRDGTMLERVEVIKYLGVMIDSKLSFANHCDYMIKKIGKKTSFLNRIGNYITPYVREIIYKSIIAPHFEYCATILVAMGETQLDKLQVAQNRAMRVILQCKRNTKVEHMLQTLQYMSVRQRLHYNVCIFIFKILKGQAPEELRDRIEIVGDGYERETRQKGNIVLQSRKTCRAQKSVFYNGVKMYNALPIEVKQCERIEVFKRRLKDYIVNTVTRL